MSLEIFSRKIFFIAGFDQVCTLEELMHEW